MMKFRVGDTVKIRVDEANCSISFAVDKAKGGCTELQEFGKIQKSNNPYYLAVCAINAGNVFQLTHYSCTNVVSDEESKEPEQEVTYIHSICIDISI